MKGVQPSAPMTFDWSAREPGSWSLPWLIAVSIILHSAAFFLFQTKEPGFRPPPRSAPSVQLLTPFAPDGSRSPGNDALLQWIATQDPALVAHIPGVEPKGLVDVSYRPSFQTIRTHPLGVPAESASIQFPPPRDPLDLIRDAIPEKKAVFDTVPPQATRVTVSATLAARAPTNLQMIVKGKADKPIEPTTVLIGVSAKGEVPLAFLQQGSGSSELDAEASAYAERLHFAPGGDPMLWGIVTFLWGDDAHVSR
jgi:hypothetical protein